MFLMGVVIARPPWLISSAQAVSLFVSQSAYVFYEGPVKTSETWHVLTAVVSLPCLLRSFVGSPQVYESYRKVRGGEN